MTHKALLALIGFEREVDINSIQPDLGLFVHKLSVLHFKLELDLFELREILLVLAPLKKVGFWLARLFPVVDD